MAPSLPILIAVAFLPPVLYTIWIRNTERRQREPWKPLIVCFAWGATVAIVISGLLEILFDIPLSRTTVPESLSLLLGAVIVAPLVEEFAKPIVLGFPAVRRESDEIEDGFVYGAAAGLGFSATENLMYEWQVLPEGMVPLIVLVVVRSIACCLIHASATAFTGYGVVRFLREGRFSKTILPFYGLAMLIHGAYNFVVSLPKVGWLITIGGGIAFALVCLRFVRTRIRAYDRIS